MQPSRACLAVTYGFAYITRAIVHGEHTLNPFDVYYPDVYLGAYCNGDRLADQQVNECLRPRAFWLEGTAETILSSRVANPRCCIFRTATKAGSSGPEGIEPSTADLETAVIPLHQRPRYGLALVPAHLLACLQAVVQTRSSHKPSRMNCSAFASLSCIIDGKPTDSFRLKLGLKEAFCR